MLSKGYILPHDNARPRMAMEYSNLLQWFWWQVLGQPPYTPDLSPLHYHVFRPLKNSFKGCDLQIIMRSGPPIVPHSAPALLRSRYSQSYRPLGCLFQYSQQLCIIPCSAFITLYFVYITPFVKPKLVSLSFGQPLYNKSLLQAHYLRKKYLKYADGSLSVHNIILSKFIGGIPIKSK